MSYYDEIKSRHVVGWLKPMIDSGQLRCRRSDGKFVFGEFYESTTSPWHHIETSPGATCPMLQQRCFQVSPLTPAGQFVPRRCQSCWKIVIRPRSLKELFALEEILERLQWPSKCGIERRSYTPCSKYRYGGYIYNRSNEEGLQRLEAIRGIIDGDPVLNGVEAYLKRGCTEMEATMGDSSKWQITPQQEYVEDMLDWLTVVDIPTSKSASHMIDHVHITWIEWACEIGDETYLEYTGGKPLYRPCVRYERGVEGTDEDTPNDESVSVGPSSRAVPKGNGRKKKKREKE
jgi:hypothetical protein